MGRERGKRVGTKLRRLEKQTKMFSLCLEIARPDMH